MPDRAGGTDPISDELERLELFEFLRLVAVALGRGKLTRAQAATAILTALDSDGTSGRGVVVNDKATATELGVSTRQVWRHFHELVSAGWFWQTRKPTRGHKGDGGRRAKYCLTDPRLDLSLDFRLPGPDSEPSSEPAESQESSDGFTSNRLTVSPESCDTAERDSGTVLPSDVLPSDGIPIPGTQLPQLQDCAREQRCERHPNGRHTVDGDCLLCGREAS
jgi:hypothetical protein